MKAKEFKKYNNYALYIRLKDLDFEFDSYGRKIIENGAFTSYEPATEEELEKLWDKEVIEIHTESSGISWGNGRGPEQICLYVSRFTEEERNKRNREKEIRETIDKLEVLTNKSVELK